MRFGVARKLRIQYSGAIYHVMNRGDHRERIFVADADRQLFLGTLEQTCEKTGLHVHAFCLMTNHFHLVVETPNANLVEGMKWLLGVYTARFNHRHKLFGHLFSGRYKAQLVETSDNGYLVRYQSIHQSDWPKSVGAVAVGSGAKLGRTRPETSDFLATQRPSWTH